MQFSTAGSASHTSFTASIISRSAEAAGPRHGFLAKKKRASLAFVSKEFERRLVPEDAPRNNEEFVARESALFLLLFRCLFSRFCRFCPAFAAYKFLSRL